MVAFLKILVTTGRILYYGKGLCKCVNEVLTITNITIPEGLWSLWSESSKEEL